MKVVELHTELKCRGQPTSGVLKSALLERLKEVLAQKLPVLPEDQQGGNKYKKAKMQGNPLLTG
eukprot:11586177-Ditylum_brightwellii.AAC.2